MQNHKPILEIKDLQIDIPTQHGHLHPVDNISFKVYPGKTYALVGESGSGKSLTALSILQLLPPQVRCAKHSKILYKGHDLLKFTEAQLRRIRGRKIAMIFQEPMTALNPVLTIGYQIKEVLARHLNLPRS